MTWWADRDKHGTRWYADRIMTNVLLLSYLDPGNDANWTVWQYVALAAVLIVFLVVLLTAVYGLTRFVKWAAQR